MTKRREGALRSAPKAGPKAGPKTGSVAALVAAVLASAVLAPPGRAADVQGWSVKASGIDPSITEFDEPNLVLRPAKVAPGTPLVIFLTGTGGRPGAAMGLLNVIAAQGYPVIDLEYPNVLAVVQACPRDPDPACSSDFRRMRIRGEGPSRAVSNSRAASIEGRLAALLARIDKEKPGQGWGDYLKDGAPDWSRIVVSGQSQGAGMAAWIARETPVARVVLFSSPWDYTLPGRQLAPWIDGPGATPPERWYAAYNSRENTADLLAESYRRLGVPTTHVRIFSEALPKGFKGDGPNPYHPIGIRDPRYVDDWRFLYGTPKAQ